MAQEKQETKRWKIALVFILGVMGYYVWFQSFYNILAEKTIYPYSSIAEMLKYVGLNLSSIAIMSVLLTMLVFKNRIFKSTALKIISDFAFSILIVAAFNILYLLILSAIMGHWVYLDWAGTFLNDFMILLINEVVFYVYNFNRKAEEVERKHAQMLQYQYDALKAQVNPHFLFNSLNILYSLVEIEAGKEKVCDFTMKLSQIYRYIMSQQDCASARVHDELEFIKSYVDVLRIRYHECFDLTIQGFDNVREHTVIPYCLQLLVENITKHNVIRKDSPMHASITVLDDHIEVSNPIFPKSTLSSSKIGLRYITQLYSHHGKDFKCVNDGKTFTAIVPFLY